MTLNKDNAVAQLIDEGLAAHRSGDFNRARSAYEAALGRSQDHPEALHLLGLVCEQQGDRKKAFQLIARAVEIDPAEPAFRCNLGALYEREGDFAKAAAQLRKVVEAAPNAQDFWARLAALELKNGDLRAATQACEKALRLNPRNIEARVARAEIQMRQHAFAEALQTGLALMDAAPADPRSYRLAGAAATALRDWRRALQIGERWRLAFRDETAATRLIASALFELGDSEKARDVFAQAVRANPECADDLSAYARYCLSTFDYEQAAQALEKAQRLEPTSAETLYGLARLEFFMGELEASETHSVRAIEADKDFTPAYAHLAQLRRGDVDDALADIMVRLAADADLLPDKKAQLRYAIGEIQHARGNYEAAMKEFAAANALRDAVLRAEARAYNPQDHEKSRDEDFGVLSAAKPPCDYAPGPASPIFIVGTPRSGSTLLESVLAAHPDAFGAGESPALPAIHEDVLLWAKQAGGARSLADASPERLQGWRDRYFQRRPKTKGARFIVDKQLNNYRSIGLIRTLFPEATIIHIRRNPVETGFSIYRNDFGKAWPFATAFEHIAHYYADYARVMAHWTRMSAPELVFVQYETFVSDFETQARKLVAACGLDWNDRCLEFYRVKRPVATFSAAQVRQPAQRRGRAVQDQYGQWLGPLVDGLRAAGVDLETGALQTAD